MTPREEGFLLLGSSFGDPARKPLTVAQLRTLFQRMANMEMPMEDRELTLSDLTALGYGVEQGMHILRLLEEKELLRRYLFRGKRMGCVPLTRVTQEYPARLRKSLGNGSPAVIWAKGDLSLLQRPAVALVGSRDIRKPNRDFAAEAGCQAAHQGYVLVSGNARGADRIAQEACLAAGGTVISVIADALAEQRLRAGVLYLSEDGFDLPFSSPRALSRNRVIHALGEKTLVAQCTLGMGGTWSGTIHNLKESWSPVFCFQDGSEAALQLSMLGAQLIGTEQLRKLRDLADGTVSLFEI